MALNGRTIASMVMLIVFAGFSAQAFFFHPAARVLPLLVGLPGCVLCLGQLIIELKDKSPGGPILSRAECAIAAWLLAFVLAIVAFGFSYGAPPLVAGYLYWVAKERLRIALLAGAFCFAFLYIFFERLMSTPLFEGLLLEYFW